MQKRKIDLGAGTNPKEGYIGLDIIPLADIQCDITGGLPFEDNSIDAIYSQDFLEHIPQDKVITVMNEIWRVLKVGGQMEHWIPNAGSRNYFASPSHLSHWNIRTFEFFEDGNRRRNVDKHFAGIKAKFKTIINKEVNFQDEYGVQIPQSIHYIGEKRN